ncbi:hypothetical protein FT663_02974 [Candidozyma haemuli var. vulneris]|nr:hypothetical protein FT663_02974 [[Candida] haemuloni var. vulneris]KAF3992759.1 hypothetical protein FT662_00968 [[Candida] haemuloni var. vulneris]
MDFSAQRYPTVEETIINNASVLYRRKKHFLTNLRQLVDGTGYVIIGLIYLRDISMFFAALRAFIHYCISNPYPTPSPAITVSDTTKKRMKKFILTSIISINTICFLKHLLFGVYTEPVTDDGYLYGGMTVQFIGEQLPKSRLALVCLDLLIAFIQIVYHNLMCCTDDSEVLKTTPLEINEEDTSCRSEIEADGYNGNVSLIALDIFDGMVETLSYVEMGQNSSLWEMHPMGGQGEETQQGSQQGSQQERRPPVSLSQLLA